MTEPVIDTYATIFDIQSFSINDGPGIRTTVFFKGCPLSCLWCHNPESHTTGVQLMYHSNLCTHCMQCVGACAQGVHGMRDVNGRLMHTVDSTLCIGSGECLKVCCYHALSLVGQRVSSDQVAQRILKDSRYFTVSEERGGVTFSGGEPMLHVPFILELVKKIPGIHICMETSGYAGRKAFEEVMPVVDLFLFDYKVTDAELHRRLCGADNTMILENLEYLYEQGKDIILRLPLIPSVNDTDEHFDGIAGIMKRYPRILRAEIMPYHTYGLAKSGELGLESSALLPRQGATDEMVDTWLEKLAERGCTKVCRS